MPSLELSRAIGIAGASMVFVSLLGIPWYVITVRITSDISYTFVYSPFSKEIKLGSHYNEFEWLYRLDATVIGLFCGAFAVLSQVATRSRRVRILSPAAILLITLLFLTLLPIHVTTASRLSFGAGVYLTGLGALLIWFSKLLSSIIVSMPRFLSYSLTMLSKIPSLHRIFLIAAISYYIIYVLMRLI